MEQKIKIIPNKIAGTVKVPPSKSMGHRAVICASLAAGISVIDNVDYSEDIIATINAMKVLGAKIECKENQLVIDGTGTYRKKGGTIDCNESGSTLRFLVPIAIAKQNVIGFTGRGNLGKRPLKVYYDIFEKQGITYTFKENTLDLCIEGMLSGGEFLVEGNISSQFISGLLFALPLLKQDSKIIIVNQLESKGYLDLTLSMMKKFGIEIENRGYEELIIKGKQTYKPCDYKVEGDYSQAGFFLCAGALGNEVFCKDLEEDSLQGDKACSSILQRLGAHQVMKEECIGFAKGDLHATIIDGAQCPDIIPVLAVVAALSKGETIIKNAQRLRIKECDRLHAICMELNKLGANILEQQDGLIINGVEKFKGTEVHSHYDHRIAMSLAIASTRCEGTLTLIAPECVKKSYPSFWEDFIKLGGHVNE